MPVSPRLELPYPVDEDENDVPADIVDLVNKLDAVIGKADQGLYSERPAAGKGKQFYWATDYRLLFYDDGTQWQEIIRSVAWTTFTPTFVAVSGGGTVQPTVTVQTQNLVARYRLVAAGTQVEVSIVGNLRMSGSSTGRSGIRISLPVAPLNPWVLDADCANDIVRGIAFPNNGGTIEVFRNGALDFDKDNVFKPWRISGVYECVNPGGIGGEVPETPETPGGAPSGPAGGDLEHDYPNPRVKDEAVRRHRVNQLAVPNGPVLMNNQKHTNQAKGTNTNDGATMANLQDLAQSVSEVLETTPNMPQGRNLFVANVKHSSSGAVANDIEFSNTSISKYVGSAWQTIVEQSSSSPGENVDPVIPGGGTDVDRKAAIVEAIDQLLAEYVQSDFVVAKDEEPGRITSQGAAAGMLAAALKGSQADFDRIRNKANSTLCRRENGMAYAPHLWARRGTVSGGVTDWNFESGADYDRVLPLARAIQLWNRQVDINDLSLLAKDLKEFTLVDDEGRKIQVSDAWQRAADGRGHHAIPGGHVFEVNPSFLNLQAYRILKAFTNDTTWDQAVAGAFDVLQKITNNSGGVPTNAGLPSDWVSWNTASHDGEQLSNGVNGWTYTQSRDYSWDAFRTIYRLFIDWTIYGDSRARDLLSGPFKAWAATTWGTTNKFVDRHQQNNGNGLSSTRKNVFAYAGYFGLIANEPGNTVAANMKSTWLTGARIENAYGKYFVGDPPGVAPSSTYYSNTWMIFAEAIDSGLWAETSLVPGINGKYNATVGGGGGGTPPGGGTAAPTTPLPGANVKLAVMRENLAGIYANALPAGGSAPQILRKQRWMWLREVPQGVWTGPEWDGDGNATEEYMDICDAQSAWFQLILYGIPNRDLGGASAGGSAGAIEYRAWWNAVISKIGTRPGVVIIEPDSIALMLGQPQADFDARMALMRELVVGIRNNCPNTWVFMDAAHAAWFPDPEPQVPGLQKAGVELCHGIVSNVSNFRTTAECAPWSENLLTRLGMPNGYWLLDVGRNGKNPAPNGGDWQNPMQVQFGVMPRFGGNILPGFPRCAGLLWIKNPGESDGDNAWQGHGHHGGPSAGELFPLYMWNTTNGAEGGTPVADNANGRLDGDIRESGNAGMLQRFPTVGVNP